MTRRFKTLSKASGMPPGTLVHVGEDRTHPVRITVFDFDSTRYEERTIERVEEAFAYRDKPGVTWINVDGTHDLAVLEKLGNHFNIHPLVLEDIANTTQRPKCEDFGDTIFFVLKMISFLPSVKEVKAEQVSVILGPGYVLSFQEDDEGDVFDLVRDRIRNMKGRVRKMGPDYLAYSLLDAVVDNYFIVLERVGDAIEEMEEAIVANTKETQLTRIHRMKRDMILLRRAIWPVREVLAAILRVETNLIRKSTVLYLRDLYDHVVQAIDTVEAFRDMLSGILEIYLSSISNRMNEIMKVLTIIATVFIPLTFVAGVYGMNFERMPELQWRYGYAAVWGVMLLMAGGMLLFFRRKKWL